MAEDMGKLTCPPPQFRFAEEGEKGNYAAYRPTTGNHEDRSGKRSYHRGNDCTASPCDEERAAWRRGGASRPQEPVSREAMAAFFYRYANSPQFNAPQQSPFRDVRPSDPFYREITWLASKGITRGWGDGTFRPVEPIHRDAMAAFVYRFRGVK